MPIILTTDVDKYLPDNLPTDITSAVIYDSILGAEGYVTQKITPKSISAASDFDKLIVSLLAAVEVRDQITGLSDAFGSRTKAMEDRAEKMIQTRIDEPSGFDDQNPLPVGAGGRAGEGATVHPIFDVPRPKQDNYADLDDDDQIRPEPWQ